MIEVKYRKNNMKPYYTVIAILVFIQTAFSAERQRDGYLYDWRLQPYNSPQEFNKEADYGSNLTLECGNSSLLNANESIKHWILPTINTFAPNASTRFWSIDGWSTTQALDKGRRIAVSVLQKIHFGFYYCVIEDTAKQTTRIVKRAVNFEGPYFGNLWEKYRYAAVLGIVSSVGFSLLAIVALVIYMWKYDAVIIDDVTAEQAYFIKKRGAFTNDGYEIEVIRAPLSNGLDATSALPVNNTLSTGEESYKVKL